MSVPSIVAVMCPLTSVDPNEMGPTLLRASTRTADACGTKAKVLRCVAANAPT